MTNSAIEKVAAFRAPDGTLHPTREEAEAHAVRVVWWEICTECELADPSDLDLIANALSERSEYIYNKLRTIHNR